MSAKYELGEVQKQFAEIVWEKEPIGSGELVKICDREFGWKKSTTYTVIKRLIDKGAIVREEPGFVCRANVSKRTVQKIETKVLLDKLFNSSLSTFIYEYLRNQELSNSEILELQRVLSERSLRP